MKTHPFTKLTAGMIAMLAGHASAIEGPADDAPPPPPVAGEAQPDSTQQPKEADAVKNAKAYLGVVSQPIPDILAEHLGIKTNEGIVVGSVMPDGPAAKAGLAVNDIIKRVGDKPVGSPQELTQIVGDQKPGEKIHLDLIRKGKPAGLDVNLGTRPDELAANDAMPQLDNLALDGMPKELADRVRDAIKGNIGRIEMQLDGDNLINPAPQADEAMRDVRKRMEEAMKDMRKNQGAIRKIIPKIDVQQGATIRMMDGKGSIELKSNNGGKEVTLRDKDNKVTWNGPWDTEQDKAAAPEDVRERIDRLNLDTDFKGGGIRLRGGFGLGGGARLQLEGGE